MMTLAFPSLKDYGLPDLYAMSGHESVSGKEIRNRLVLWDCERFIIAYLIAVSQLERWD